MLTGGWPFATLTAEHQSVLEAEASQLPSRGFVIVGGSGFGKTALARTWLAAAPGASLWITATKSSRQVPFGVFAHLIDDDADDPLAELRAARRTVERAGTKLRIVIDDAHLLDGTSAMFVHHVVDQSLASVVVTVHSEFSEPDAVRALWKDGLLKRIDLHEFSSQDCAEVCELALGGPVASESVARLHHASEGVPLYLRHLVENAHDRGEFYLRRGLWRFEGPSLPGPYLADEFARDLMVLDHDVREVVRLVAFGEPLDVEDLASIADARAMEVAESQGFIEVGSDGEGLALRVAPPLLGEYLRAHTGALRAHRIRGQLFEAAGPWSKENRGNVLRLALLALDSDRDPPLELLLAAAVQAISFSDLATGERIARAALDLNGGFDAALMLANALSWQGKGEEAEALLEKTAVDDVGQLARWSVPRIANRFWTLGDVDAALVALGEVTEAVADESLLVTVRAVESAMALSLGDLSRSVSLAAGVLARADADASAVTWASGTLSVAFSLLGRGDDSLKLADRVGRLAAEFDSTFVNHSMVLGLMLGGTLTGRLEETENLIALHSDGDIPATSARAFVFLTKGSLLLARGRTDEACEWLAAATGLLSESDATGWGVLAHLTEAEAAALAGKTDVAEHALDAALAGWGRIHALFVPRSFLTRAAVAAVKGETSTAIAFTRRSARLAAAAHQFALAAVALHTALRYGDTSVSKRLAELAARCDGDLPLTMAGHADAVVRRDAELLVATSERFEALGFGPLAVDAAIDAAEEFARRADAAGEFAMRARVRGLEAGLGPLDSPALRRHRRPLPVTAREREVATLVGEGLSNRTIAERLTVSERTVEGHIYHACNKLGLANKKALAAARIDGEGDHVADYA